MDGTAELLQLAMLLRMGATTAREIAIVRKADLQEIYTLADQAEAMADDMERVARRPLPEAGPRLARSSRN